MRYCICIFASLTVTIASASQDTNGPHGINSTGLVGFDGNPLTGNGVSIGQVELERSGEIYSKWWPRRCSTLQYDDKSYRRFLSGSCWGIDRQHK